MFLPSVIHDPGGIVFAHLVGVGRTKAQHLGDPGESTFTLKEALDLKTAIKPVLKFDVKGLTSPEDAVVIQAELRPAGQDWQPLGHDARGNHVFVASVVADLQPYAGQTVGLRFRGVTKAGKADSKGMYLDDVAVIEPQ